MKFSFLCTVGLTSFFLILWEVETLSYPYKIPIRNRRSAFLQLSWIRNENYGVVFVYSDEFYPQEISAIHGAADEIRRYSCLPISVYSYTKFFNSGGQRHRLFRNYVYISRNSHRGCNADIGMLGGAQRMNLDPMIGCQSKQGVIIHEMMHTIGFDHEQNRPDRDHFVNVHFGNILKEEVYNFQIKPKTIAVGNYDYNSIMHYPSNSYARNPRFATISSSISGYSVPRFPVLTLSPMDKEKIKKITGCKNTLI